MLMPVSRCGAICGLFLLALCALAAPPPLPTPDAGGVFVGVKALLAPTVAAGQNNPLTLTPDGKMAVVQGAEPRTVQFVSVASGNVLRTLSWPSTLAVTRYAVSPDGATLAVFAQELLPVEKTVTKQVEQKKGWKKETVTVTEKVTEQVSCRQLKLLTVETTAEGKCFSLEADLPKADTTLQSLQYSADGTVLVGLDTANTIHLWEVTTGKQVAAFTDLEGFTAVALSPDNAWLAAASPDHTIKRWDVKSQKALDPLEGHNRADVFLLVASPDGKRLASADRDGHVLLWDTTTWKPVVTLLLNPAESGVLTGLAISPDGTVLATTQRMRTQPDVAHAQQATYWRAAIRLWNVRTGALLTAISENEWFADYTQVAFNRTGNTLAALSWGFSGKEANAPWTTRVACWRVNQEAGIATEANDSPVATAPSMLHTLPTVITGMPLNPTSNQRTYRLQKRFSIDHRGSFLGYTFDNNYVVMLDKIDNDRDPTMVSYLSVISGERVKQITLARNGSSWYYYGIKPGSNLLLMGNDDCICWYDLDAQKRSKVFNLKLHIDQHHFSIDGSILAVLGKGKDSTVSNRLIILRTTDMKIITNISDDQGINCMSINADNTLVATGCGDKTVKIWSINDGKMVRIIPNANVNKIYYSKDGKTIIQQEHDILIHDTNTYNIRFRIRPAYISQSFALSDDSWLLAVVTYIKNNRSELKIYDPSDGRLLASQEGDYRAIHGMWFSPDSTLLAVRIIAKYSVWPIELYEIIRE